MAHWLNPQIWANEAHCTLFNGWEKNYAMNNMIILDHHRLFICMDIRYFNTYHNVNILWHSNIYKHWHQHENEYFEYLFGDLGYLVKYIFYAQDKMLGIITIFQPSCNVDVMYEVISDQNVDTTHGWARDF